MEQEVATQVQLRQVHRDACWAQSSYTQYVMEQDNQTWNLNAVTEEKDLGVFIIIIIIIIMEITEAGLGLCIREIDVKSQILVT